MKKNVLFLMFVIVLLLGACGRTKEIDLTKYVRYEISGVNGKGKMFLSLDEQLYADAAEKTDKLSAEEIRRIIERDVALSSGEDRLLSNGDEAVIEVSCLSEDETLKKEPDFDRIGSLTRDLDTVQQQIKAQPMYQALQQARKGFSDMMGQVNAELSATLNPGGSSGGCSGNCAACGGCG